uniref:Uncharacterized protein n=1 Tax=Chromera velia CCMP2878 TaxID=1169474 RepID=A0A0G4HT68_9ALVE|eukprot:Cvel_8380.t1-p1 / transcript=Cvel_8380.t1 / gene=Cvel_8380 / organism=Chromera_velia_CCMP2878 / gene_product=Ankyrin-1, putative / transcript_product=Ankyrin-1, putative / location=Cvel_scaffold461:83477-84847(-) / protein_length=457 / sequence_SO=supercontig / SO=protein_coding / is_pseudo=false
MGSSIDPHILERLAAAEAKVRIVSASAESETERGEIRNHLNVCLKQWHTSLDEVLRRFLKMNFFKETLETIKRSALPAFKPVEAMTLRSVQKSFSADRGSEQRCKDFCLLLRFGTDLEAVLEGERPLTRAAKDGHTKAVGLLLRNGANGNSKNEAGESALLIALKKGEEGEQMALRLCSEESVNVVVTDPATTYTGLHLCTTVSVAERLVARGADVNAISERGASAHPKCTPISFAAHRGLLPLVRFLLNNGADVNKKAAELHESALQIALSRSKWEVARCLLVEGRANVNGTTSTKNTVLHVAATSPDAELVREIIEAEGGSLLLKKTNNNGYSALHSVSAMGVGSREVAEVLVKAGVDVDLQDKNGRTALMHACMKRFERVAEYLVETTPMCSLKGRINATDTKRNTGLMLAAQQGSVRIVSLLLQKGANAAAENDAGLKAKDFASAPEILQLLP